MTLWDLFVPFFLWRVWEKLRCETTFSFFVKKEDLASSLASFSFETIFSSSKTFPSSKTQLSTPLSISTQSILLPNLKTFHSLNFHETDQPTLDCIHIFIQKSWKIFYCRSKYFPSWSNMKISTCTFMFQIWVFGESFNFAHEIGCLACMTSLPVLASNHLGFS